VISVLFNDAVNF